jgi:glycosyltransferase involved in cell wall biosynthesis
MKISAYMFVRNGLRAGYTFLEAIENVLPFVDEFFVLDGKSDDGTLEALEALAKLDGKLKLESAAPAYVGGAKDAKGLLLGAAFEEARQKCAGDWLIQVQADTVFHPVTLLAVREFLLREGPNWSYDAIEVFRRQYRWNWQEMYREDRLALIFRKAAGRVVGDALNVQIDGKISARFLPLFERFPLADNAWVFFENLAGKRAGCREIWDTPQYHGKGAEFPWYDKATGRDFNSDLAAYTEKGLLPPFWREKESPFKSSLPDNLAGLVGLNKYSVHHRFSRPGGLYSPSVKELEKMRALAGVLRAPFREGLEELLVSAGFGKLIAWLRKLLRG